MADRFAGRTESPPMSEPRSVRCAIIGSGPAGYTAAVYAARALLEPVLIAGLEPGGQLTITTDVENYPGFAKPIQGPWLMEQMQAQAEHVGAQILNDIVIEADLSSRPFRLICDPARSCWPRPWSFPPAPSPGEMAGPGVGKNLPGLPGSRPAPPKCGRLLLSRQGGAGGRRRQHRGRGGAVPGPASPPKVTVVHRRDEFRAERILQNRLFAHPKIQVIWNTALEAVLGTGGSRAASPAAGFAQPEDRRPDRCASCDGVFIAIGHAPPPPNSSAASSR